MARDHLERVIRRSRNATVLLYRLILRTPAIFRAYRFPRAADALLNPFRQSISTSSCYENLLKYFAQGWDTYRTNDGAGADYPGLPSWSGRDVDQLEGFARIMPLFGAWCASGREQEVELVSNKRLSLPKEFERGLVRGTDTNSKHYWGEMVGKSPQRIVEAADVALALWFFKDTVWQSISTAERDRIATWLAQMERCPGLDKNWHLFYVLTDRVLQGLGYPGLIPSARRRFERVKEFHLGDGWFEDGPGGHVDYYNAWGFHYPMYWIDQIDPQWDPEFIRSTQRSFLSSYKHLLSPQGYAVLGRSIAYRVAVAAPLVFGHRYNSDVVSAGQARRALDVTWSYFIRKGAVRRGAVTQGYHGSDPRLVDNYSGPASALWSLRSLVAAFHLPRDSSFWTTPHELLPVEEKDFDISLDGPGWLVRGRKSEGSISIEVLANDPNASPSLHSFGISDYLKSIAALRPRNDEAKYGRRYYRSDRPFCVDD